MQLHINGGGLRGDSTVVDLALASGKQLMQEKVGPNFKPVDYLKGF
jgi:hypothetical protein